MRPFYLCADCRRKASEPFSRLNSTFFLRQASFLSLIPDRTSSISEHGNRDTNFDAGNEKAAPIRKRPTALDIKDRSLGEKWGSGSTRSRSNINWRVAIRSHVLRDENIPRGPAGASPQAWGGSISPIAELDNLLRDPNSSLVETWTFFIENFSSKQSPALLHPTLQDRVRLQRGLMFESLFQKIMKSSCEDVSQGLPNPASMIQIFERAGLMRPAFFEQALWTLLMHLVQDANNQNRISKFESQLMIVWTRIFQVFSKDVTTTVDESLQPEIDWRNLPDIRGETFYNHSTKGQQASWSPFRIISMLPKFPNHKRTSLAAAILATFGHFSIQPNAAATIQEAYKPFLVFAAGLLYRANIENSLKFVEEKFINAGISLQQTEDFLGRLSEVPFRAMVVIGSGKSLDSQLAGETEEISSGSSTLEEYFVARLGRIERRGSYAKVEELWVEAQRAFEVPQGPQSATAPENTDMKSRKTRIPPKLYLMLIRIAYRMERPNAAIDIWNHMIEHGQTPSVVHWTKMIQGSGTMKDEASVDKLWHRMLSSGISPDNTAWTARIQALTNCGQFDFGLSLLDDMWTSWLTAAKNHQLKNPEAELGDIGDLPGAPKPDAVTVSRILTILAKSNEHFYIRKLMNWAAFHGIELNEYTYNMLIAMHVRSGDLKEALKVMDRMRAHGAGPDVVTFTSLLSGIFKRDSGQFLPPEKHHSITANILDLMESSGIQANDVTFSTIVKGLLLQYDNFDAAQSVIRYMEDRKKPFSPHIHTIFMKYYFREQPVPNLDAVEALWERINTANLRVDILFFSTMVEGFARAGKIRRMMTFLARMGKNGMTTSWSTLTIVVRTLVDTGEWEKAQTIVNDVSRSEAEGRMGGDSSKQPGMGKKHRDAFWLLVESFGLQPLSV